MEKAITAKIQLQREISEPTPGRCMFCPYEITTFSLQRSAKSKDFLNLMGKKMLKLACEVFAPTYNKQKNN